MSQRERPILFGAEMVRAILSGAKSQTRRLVTSRGGWSPGVHDLAGLIDHGGSIGLQAYFGAERFGVKCPLGAPGDRLWVKETWAHDAESLDDLRAMVEDVVMGSSCGPYYRADGVHENSGLRWRRSTHMPRWCSRITLEITDVRVQRLRDISEEDARAEGAVFTDFGQHEHTLSADGGLTWGKTYSQKSGWHFGDATSSDECLGSARMAFANLWDRINSVDGRRWSDSPWVWCLTFKRIEQGAAHAAA